MKLNNFFSTIAAGALLLGLGACSDEVSYEPTSPYEGDEVYFAENEETAFMMLPTETSVDVPLYRVKADKDIEVALTYEAVDSEGNKVNDLFNVPATITFPKDSKEIAVPINYAFDKIAVDTEYSVTISIDGKETSPWGLREMTFKLSYSPWSEWERVSSDPAEVSYGWPFGIQFLQYLYTRKSLVNENKIQYMVPDPYGDVDFQLIFEIDKTDFYYNENNEKCFRVRTPQVGIDVQIDEAGNTLALQDVYSWYMWAWDNEKTPEDAYKWMAAKGYGDSNFNTVTGLLSVDYMAFSFTIPKGNAYSNDYYYFQFPGYADYSFAFDTVGNFVSPDGDESVVVSVLKGADVASFAAKCVSGTLSEAQVEEAAKALVESGNFETYTTNPTELRLPMEDAGDYTLVVVGFDEMMNQVAVSSYNFTFESVQKENEWVKFGEGDLTDWFISNVIWFGQEGSEWTPEHLTWPVQILKHKQIEGYYRIENPYYEWPLNVENDYEVIPKSKAYYIDVHAENPDGVYIDLSPIGFALNGGEELYGYSIAANELAGGATLEDLIAGGYTGYLEDGVIIFPAGTLAVALLPSGQMGYANKDEDAEFLSIYNLMPEEPKAPAIKAPSTKMPKVKTNYFDFRRPSADIPFKGAKNGVERYIRPKSIKATMLSK